MLAYQRYLLGDCPMPQSFKQSLLFTFFMAVGMGLCMISVVGVVTHMSLEAFAFVLTHVVPIMMLIGASIRLFIFEKPIGFIIRHGLAPRLNGMSLSLGIVLTNVACMATIMCALGTAVSNVLAAQSFTGLSGFLDAYLGILPIIYVSATFVSFFLVGPCAKMLFSKALDFHGKHRNFLNGMRTFSI